MLTLPPAVPLVVVAAVNLAPLDVRELTTGELADVKPAPRTWTRIAGTTPKSAVTVLGDAGIVSVQVSGELGSGVQPAQPKKSDPDPGVARKLMDCPGATSYVQVDVHVAATDAMVVVIVPLPAPTALTVSGTVNVAVTVVSPVIVSGHEPEPEHPPLQPENTQPEAGLACSVNVVPLATDAKHVMPNCVVETQSTGRPVIWPSPSINTVTLGKTNPPNRVIGPVTMKVHGLVEQKGDSLMNQPSKRLELSGLEVIVTVAP